MSDTLLVVITHPAGYDTLCRNLPWLARSGCDMAIVNHDGDQRFPMGAHRAVSIGGPPSSHPHGYVSRFLEVVDYFMSNPEGHKHLCFTEYDSIFLKPCPRFRRDNMDIPAINATLAGYKSDGFLSKQFFHAPWYFDLDSANCFCQHAERLIDVGLDEKGFIDRFLGLVVDLYPFQFEPMLTFSRNTIVPAEIEAAKWAIKNGAIFLHGVKTEECLKALTEGIV